MSYVLDPFTADTLRAMVRTSRWPDEKIAKYLGIHPRFVLTARDSVPRNAGGTGHRAKLSDANRRSVA